MTNLSKSLLNYFFIKVLLFSLIITISKAKQVVNYPIPDITNYPPEVNGGFTSNWGITEGPDGKLYFANNYGVLVYDGKTWSNIILDNNDPASDGKQYINTFNMIFSATTPVITGPALTDTLTPTVTGTGHLGASIEIKKVADNSVIGSGTVDSNGDFAVALNAGSITDNGTGDFTNTITNPMSNVNYANTIGSLYVQAWGQIGFFRSTARTTATYVTGSVNYHNNGNATDSTQFDTSIDGDLA